QPVGAFFAVAAAVDDAADADQVAGREPGDVGADLGHPADDLVARHAREDRPGPFGPHLVQVGMADAAIGDLDPHVFRAGLAPGDVERHQRLVAGMGAVGLDGHGRFLRKSGEVEYDGSGLVPPGTSASVRPRRPASAPDPAPDTRSSSRAPENAGTLPAMDFTQGAIPPKLVRFSLPILLANLLQASMQLVNGLWVGNLLGSAAFAAVTVATTLLAMVLAFVLGINNATLTIFAQLRGAGDAAGIDRFLGGFTLILLALSVLVGTAGLVFAEPLLVLLDTPASILGDARAYLQVSFAGTLFLVGYNFVGTLLRAFGDSRTPLYFVLLATGLAAVLAPAFMAGLGTGVS